MICEEARMEMIREVGGERESGDASILQGHLSECPACEEYRRDVRTLWDAAGEARERCLSRSLALGPLPLRPPGSRAGLLGMTASIAAAAALMVWALSARPPGAVNPPGPVLDQGTGAPSRQDDDLTKRVSEVAAEEKTRLAVFEQRLADILSGTQEAEGLARDKKWEEAEKRAEALLGSFPKIRLAILDPSLLEFRSRGLQLRLSITATRSKVELLRLSQLPLATRAEAEILLMNKVRSYLREQEELNARGPQSRKEPVVTLGGPSPSLQQETLDKLRAIRITFEAKYAESLSEFVKYLRDTTGLNILADVPEETKNTRREIILRDVPLEALVDHVSKLYHLRWEVDRFGIVFFSADKR